MIGRTNAGNAGIRFKVVGGTEQPSGLENWVWVNTEKAITSWVVSPNQPSEPAEGMVWIQSGDKHGINVLRKNAIEVFPVGCKLYTDSQWKTVDAYLYKDAAWVQFNRYYLYQEGNECSDITNGWALSTSGTRTHGDKLVKNADSMSFTSRGVGGKNYACGFLRTNKMISLAGFRTLKIEFESVTAAYQKSAAVATTLDKYDLIDHQSSINAQTAITVGLTEVSVDISSLSGSYYVGACAGLDGTTTMVIKNIWLE